MACGKWEIPADGMCLLNPTLLFEVLSPSTRDYDCGAKREHYQHLPSLRHLLLVDQPDRLVRHWWRLPDGAWTSRDCSAGRLTFPEWDGSIELDDIYLFEE